MRPDYRILADSRDITAVIRDRLIELRVTDVSGVSSDTVEIRLDDRVPQIALPHKGAELDVSIGYRESGFDRCGLFTVDEIAFEGPPDTMAIRARAADLRQGMKSPKSRSFDNITIGDLVAAIAGEHGYKPKVSENLTSVAIAHLDQTEESDLNLLTRVARDHAAVAKPAGGLLLFVPEGQAKSAGGKDLPTVSMTRQDLTRWSVTLADRGRYASVVAVWRDLGAAADVEVTAGSGEPAYRLRGTYRDEAAARAAARARLAAFERGAGTISGTCAGETRLMAEGKIALSGIRAGVDGPWELKQVVHVISGRGGYICEFEGETPK